MCARACVFARARACVCYGLSWCYVVFLQKNILKFWLEKGVDAFNIDHVDFLFESEFIDDDEDIINFSVANTVSSFMSTDTATQIEHHKTFVTL